MMGEEIMKGLKKEKYKDSKGCGGESSVVSDRFLPEFILFFSTFSADCNLLIDRRKSLKAKKTLSFQPLFSRDFRTQISLSIRVLKYKLKRAEMRPMKLLQEGISGTPQLDPKSEKLKTAEKKGDGKNLRPQNADSRRHSAPGEG